MDGRDWLIRVMEIRKNPASATPEEILKLADDYFYNLYFGKSVEHVQYIADLGQRLSSSTLNKE